MYSKFQIGKKFLNYYLTAANSKGHGTHSPFIFHFITKVLNDKSAYSDYEKINSLRKKLSADHTMLDIEDFGAGSAIQSTRHRSVSSILKNAAKPEKYGKLFYRISRMYQPKTILELGTSLGISAAYLALGNPDAQIITLEGAANVASLARENLAEIGAANTKLVTGNFDYTLAEVIKKLDHIDLIFIDGNHRREPTERYFHQLLPLADNDTIMIFDDIHWSAEMELAWETISQHPSVTTSVDMFFIGIVFFRREFMEKQAFIIRF